jgi:hypothetical protein
MLEVLSSIKENSECIGWNAVAHALEELKKRLDDLCVRPLIWVYGHFSLKSFLVTA